MNRFLIKCISLLLNNDLSVKDRSLCTSLLLDKLQALPIKDIIIFNEDGSVVVNGKTLTSEQLIQLRESARGALNNIALKLIHEQVNFISVTTGIHKAHSAEQLLFGQSAIWFGQREMEILRLLANYSDASEMEQELTL